MEDQLDSTEAGNEFFKEQMGKIGIKAPKFSDAHKLREAAKKYGESCEAFGFALQEPEVLTDKRMRKDKAWTELNQMIAEYVDNTV